MKKISSIILALSLIIGTMPTIFASPTEDILNSIKDRVGNTDKYEDFTSEIIKEQNKTLYNFYWSTESDENYEYMSVSCNENRIIESYNTNRNYQYSDKLTVNKPSAEEAELRAKELLEKLNPEICNNLELSLSGNYESLHNNGYYFTVQRVENSVPVVGNSGSLRLSADLSAIENFYISYISDLSFKAPENILSREDALSAYEEKIGLTPSYKFKYDGKNRDIYLSYEPENSNFYIDAFSGEITEEDYAALYNNMAKQEAAMTLDAVGGSGGSRLSEAEISELQKIDGLISEEKAQSIVRANKILGITKDLELSSSRLTSDRYEEDKFYYNFEFRKNSEKDYAYYSVTLDAKDGTLLSFSGYDSADDREQKNIASDRKKAEEYAKALTGEKLDEFLKNDSVDTSSAVSYTRQINGIDFRDNTITVDVINGKLKRYVLRYNDVSVPSADDAISAEEALGFLADYVDFNLYYIPNSEGYSLAYGFDKEYPLEIDAYSGKLLQGGTEYKKEAPASYSDISGHFAEDAIKTLASFGIAFEGSEFKPNEIITQKDFITLLISTFYRYSPIIIKASDTADDSYSNAISEGIILKDEKNPEAPVTRENAAVMIIRALRIDEYASLPDIFISPFADVTENIGHISILGAMGVFGGDQNGNFLPDKAMTRAEAIMCIYNYLSK